jgi:uncharacterized protein DUF5655
MAQGLTVSEYELFLGKEELLPAWMRIRSHVEGFGDDVDVELREPFAELERGGALFAIAEPTADKVLKLGLHNPGMPFDERFRNADRWGPRKITHLVAIPADAEVDDDLHARLHLAYELAREGEPR